jgi:hypothetical protein
MKRWTVLEGLEGLEGISAAFLLLFPFYMPFLVPSNLVLLNHGLPLTNLIGGLLVDLLGVAILATGFLVAVRYLPSTIQRIIIALFAGLILWRIVEIAIVGMQTDLRITAYWLGIWRQSCIAIFLLSGVLAFFLPRITQPAVRAVRLVIAAFAFSALWIVPQLLYLALVRQTVQSTAPSHLFAPANSSSNRRIIWILFDELSYDQTFDHPAPGMKLPNFDRLRTESVSFSNLKPAGFYTDRIIPSLFLGRRINQIRSTVDGNLWYKDESQNRWFAYDPNATLFALAQRNGWNTGVDGCWIPYCRVFAPMLNVCSWEHGILPIEALGASEDKSILANAAVLSDAILAKVTKRTGAGANIQMQQYRNLMAHTQPLIENGQVRFVFLHINTPHPPGIYDRQHHILRPGGTYLDNLVLADDTLGALLQDIDATPSASETTVIVSSDHSWRIPMWRPTADWSTEEERASGGRFDERPVFLIHFPGQNSENDMNSALPELLEHDIIAGMLLGKINNSEDLATFFAQHGRGDGQRQPVAAW